MNILKQAKRWYLNKIVPINNDSKYNMEYLSMVLILHKILNMENLSTTDYLIIDKMDNRYKLDIIKALNDTTQALLGNMGNFDDIVTINKV